MYSTRYATSAHSTMGCSVPSLDTNDWLVLLLENATFAELDDVASSCGTPSETLAQ